jgi:hypothetical protein
MQPKKQDPTDALVVVVKALEPLAEADRQWVLQSAASRWSVTVLGPATSPGGISPNAVGGPNLRAGGAAAADVESAIAKQDARAFIRIKRPTTDVQRVACLGYFLAGTTRNPGFSSKDVTKAHTDSGGSKINMTRALDNATRSAKYLSNRGPKEKQLTTLGEDIVVALPDQQAVKEIESSAKGRGKARAKKKSKK